MADFVCPQCGAPITFRSRDLVMRVCDYCRSAILRDGDTLRAAGKAAVVPDDVSPLQLGTRGRFDAQAFELVGRVRWHWADGGWNEWLVLYGDGRHGWLGEALGRFMLLGDAGQGGRQLAIVRKIANGGMPMVGENGSIAGTSYVATDVRQVVCVASEGELPSPTITGTKALSIDMMAADGRCASIQREGRETHVYVGRYVTLADLAATNLRAFEGWPMPRYAAA